MSRKQVTKNFIAINRQEKIFTLHFKNYSMYQAISLI